MNEIYFTKSEVVNGIIHMHKITFRKSKKQLIITVESVKSGANISLKPFEEKNIAIILNEGELKRLKEFLNENENTSRVLNL